MNTFDIHQHLVDGHRVQHVPEPLRATAELHELLHNLRARNCDRHAHLGDIKEPAA